MNTSITLCLALVCFNEKTREFLRLCERCHHHVNFTAHAQWNGQGSI